MVKTARDIMHEHTFVSGDMIVRDIAKLMSDKKIGSVLVEADGDFGILTERDIVSKIIAGGKNPEKVKAKDIMTYPVFTIGPDAELYMISKIFNEKSFRRLPVVENGEVIGILTTKDVAKQFIPEFFKEMYHFKDFRF